MSGLCQFGGCVGSNDTQRKYASVQTNTQSDVEC